MKLLVQNMATIIMHHIIPGYGTVVDIRGILIILELKVVFKIITGEFADIKGYYIPVEMDGNSIIISKYPYTSCFFCGGAGPESVAAVKVNGKIGEYYLDELITVRGRFAVNDSDVDMLNFIIEDAKILDE